MSDTHGNVSMFVGGNKIPCEHLMTDKHPKRPRDLNAWAKRMIDIATGENALES